MQNTDKSTHLSFELLDTPTNTTKISNLTGVVVLGCQQLFLMHKQQI
jgi:hypothetical protein